MRVSLRFAGTREPQPGTDAVGHALLDPDGAHCILGADPTPGKLAVPIAPSATTLFGPRGACLAAPEGPLIVSDTGHHRLLVWHAAPKSDGVPADLVIGQDDFASEGRNGRTTPSARTLNVPTGVAFGGGVLAVADAWNHRVLLWHGIPTRSNQPADVVLGQPDFSSVLANRGSSAPAADTLNWCYGVAIIDGALWVADTGNRRVLCWSSIPVRSGTPADLVLGQADFTTRDENAGREAGEAGMRWPHAIAAQAGALLIADAGNNRIMVWSRMPDRNGAACAFVLGQGTLHGVDHNRSAYYPTAESLNMPYGLGILRDQVVVADTANSRLLGFPLRSMRMSAPATHLCGQRSFADKGDNRWGMPRRDSLCWPYGLSASSNTLAIADSGNNRVLLWEACP